MATLTTLIDRLIGDEAFRESFYRTPLDLVHDGESAVSSVAVCALLNVQPIYFAEFARGLTAPIPAALSKHGSTPVYLQAH